MLLFYIGTVVGGIVGFITCALLSANGRDDDE